MKRILVIAPHPDDEVLGCGGTIKKYTTQGDEVYLCIVTKAYAPDWTEDFIKNRKKEIECSAKILGIKKVFLLDLPTVKLDTLPQKELNDLLLKVVEDVGPETVYIPFGSDINKDHKLVSESSLVALRPKPGFSVKKVFYYEVLSETEWAKPAQKIEDILIPNFYEDILGYLDGKLKAMKCYKTELKKSPHPRSLEIIKVLAQKRGSEVGVKYAEAFQLVRLINN